MLSIIAPALLSLTAAELPRSPFVEEDHSHDWSLLFQEDEEAAWLDLVFEGTFVENDKPYPTILMRGIERKRGDVTPYADYIMAIDCDGQRAAPVDGWFLTSEDQDGEQSQPRIRELRSLRSFPTELRDPIFRHVCGPQWTYEPAP